MTLPVLSFRATPPAGTLPVSLDQLMVGGLLLQAGSGGGKSRAIRQLLEETHGRVQHLVIDPEGEFASLRERFDYVHAAPHGADVVATPKTARLLCRRLVETGASAVLDIYDLKVHDKVHEKREFVRLFLEELMVLPRALWTPILIVVDEADFFFPQQGESSALEAGLDVNGRGRKRGYRMVLTTRRLSKLHKDAADLQNRMIGYTGLDLDVKRAGDELGLDKEARAQLTRLEQGTFFVYGPAITRTPILARSGEVTTTHPEPGKVGKAAPPAPAKIRALIAQLADLPKEAEEEAKTLEELRRQVKERDTRIRQMEKGAPTDPVAVQERIKAAVDREVPRAIAAAMRQHATTMANLRRALEAAMKFIINVSTHNFDVAGVDKAELEKALTAAVGRATQIIDQRLDARARQVEQLRQSAQKIAAQLKAALGDEDVVIAVDVARNEPFTVSPTRTAPARPAVTPRAASSDAPTDVSPAMQRVLNALAALETLGIAPAKRLNVAYFAGYTENGHFNNMLGSLRTMGLLEYPSSGVVALTDAGRTAADASAGAFASLDELHQVWLNKVSPSEAKLLSVLIERYPNPIERAALAEATGYTENGHFNNMLGHLRTLGVADYPGNRKIVATDVLFPEGL